MLSATVRNLISQNVPRTLETSPVSRECMLLLYVQMSLRQLKVSVFNIFQPHRYGFALCVLAYQPNT